MPLISPTEVQCLSCQSIRPVGEFRKAGDAYALPACACGSQEFFFRSYATAEFPISEHGHIVNTIIDALEARPRVTFSGSQENPLNTEALITLTLDQGYPCDVPVFCDGALMATIPIDSKGIGLLALESPDPSIIILSVGYAFQCTPFEVIFNG